MKSREGMSKDR